MVYYSLFVPICNIISLNFVLPLFTFHEKMTVPYVSRITKTKHDTFDMESQLFLFVVSVVNTDNTYSIIIIVSINY